MKGLAPGIANERRDAAADCTAFLQSVSSELIRVSHHRLQDSIRAALAHLGEALAADRALLAVRDPNAVSGPYVWERRRMDRSTPDGRDDRPDRLLGLLELERTIVCGNRKQFPVAALGGARLPDQTSSAILAPLRSEGGIGGVLAVTARTPRSWTPDAVKATEWLADMVAAGLDRLVALSSVDKEKGKRLHAEAETRRLREQIAHAGRVSMLGELAASLAHELNQPLTAIYSNAQAAQRFLEHKPPALEEVAGALGDLDLDCRRAVDVLGRMRQMFRRQETERVPLSIGAVIEHVLMLLREDAVARDVNVAVDVAPDLPPVNGDRVQLEQVLMNLLVNAFEAVTGLAGPREVTVRASARDGSVQLAVLDSGRGITRGDLERIFDPFFTRKSNGMGMGLAICRTIVEAHGGRISARSKTRGGSAFELSLPAMPSAEATGAGQP